MAAATEWWLAGPNGDEIQVADGLVLGRQHLGVEFSYVSRRQAVLDSLAGVGAGSMASV